jgi:cell division protein FtsI (penicillin-binding protein 3)
MEKRQARAFLNARYWSMCVFFRLVFIVGFCLILGKALMLQILEHPDWEDRARGQSESTLNVPTYRGSIYDGQGQLLAYSVPQPSLFADCGGMDKEELKGISGQLAPILDESQASLEKKLERGRRFIWVKRYLTDQQASAVAKLKLNGLHFVTEYKRFYPRRHLAGHVLGFVGYDGAGMEGVEKAFDDFLKADARSAEQFRDGSRNRAWFQSSPPLEPAEYSSIRLTLDSYIQYVAECELEKTVKQYNAKSGQAVVLDTETSEVLAMANWPPFDPNCIENEGSHPWRNNAILDLFEPGSTFKVFVVAAALEEKAIKERERVFCENGKCKMAGHMINDVHPYGWLTVPEVIKYSSNIGASKLAMQLGSEQYYSYIRAFGFGEATGVNLPGESSGLVRPWKKWRSIDLVTAAFGQSIGVSALQLTAAVGCLANDGQYIQPTIVKELKDANGNRVDRFDSRSRRQVVEKKTARKVAEMMALVTQEGGTGINAAVPGYITAGKTGTAQKIDPATRRYSTSKYTSIFTGFVPVDKPRLAMTVVIHEPHGAIYGGVVAAPVFRNIASQALPYLKVPPSVNDTTPPAAGFKVVNAALNSSATVSSSAAASSSPIVRKSVESAPPEQIEEQSATMPDLLGLSLKMALKRLSPLKVQAKFKGSGRVVEQNPPAGAPLEAKDIVELALKEAQ